MFHINSDSSIKLYCISLLEYQEKPAVLAKIDLSLTYTINEQSVVPKCKLYTANIYELSQTFIPTFTNALSTGAILAEEISYILQAIYCRQNGAPDSLALLTFTYVKPSLQDFIPRPLISTHITKESEINHEMIWEVAIALAQDRIYNFKGPGFYPYTEKIINMKEMLRTEELIAIGKQYADLCVINYKRAEGIAKRLNGGD
jgi:hypothetical protein